MNRSSKDVFKKFFVKAFTLAEVLIVMGVIGIIAEMTIPSLVQNFQKQQVASQLSKAYTNLAEAIKRSEIDNGSNEFWDWGVEGTLEDMFNKNFRPYLNISRLCFDPDGTTSCGFENATAYTYIKGYSCNGFDAIAWGGVTAVLSDGSVIFLHYYSGSALGVDDLLKLIIIDVNGPKDPNRFGKDTFLFVLVPDRGLMPYKYDETTANIALKCKNATGKNGVTCAAKIMKDGWQIKDDYPWDI